MLRIRHASTKYSFNFILPRVLLLVLCHGLEKTTGCHYGPTFDFDCLDAGAGSSEAKAKA